MSFEADLRNKSYAYEVTCDVCGGSGEQFRAPCHKCNGRGKMMVYEKPSRWPRVFAWILLIAAVCLAVYEWVHWR